VSERLSNRVQSRLRSLESRSSTRCRCELILLDEAHTFMNRSADTSAYDDLSCVPTTTSSSCDSVERKLRTLLGEAAWSNMMDLRPGQALVFSSAPAHSTGMPSYVGRQSQRDHTRARVGDNTLMMHVRPTELAQRRSMGEKGANHTVQRIPQTYSRAVLYEPTAD
jgi:hypothetical protein